MGIENWKKQDEWYWEGNVQARVVSYLRDLGYETTAADTLRKARGPDILAVKGDEKILIEVKGWPGDKYADGVRAGTKKKANPSAQAVNWFSQALLSLMAAKSKYMDHKLVLAVPDFPRYRKLSGDTEASLDLLGIEVWFVTADYIVLPTAKTPEPTGHTKRENCEIFFSPTGRGTLLLTFIQRNGSVFFKNKALLSEPSQSLEGWVFQQTRPYPLPEVKNPTPAGEAARES